MGIETPIETPKSIPEKLTVEKVEQLLRTQNIYEFLGIPSNASKEVVEKNRRAKIRMFHSDKNTGNTDAYTLYIQALNACSKVLASTQMRERYNLYKPLVMYFDKEDWLTNPKYISPVEHTSWSQASGGTGRTQYAHEKPKRDWTIEDLKSVPEEDLYLLLIADQNAKKLFLEKYGVQAYLKLSENFRAKIKSEKVTNNYSQTHQSAPDYEKIEKGMMEVPNGNDFRFYKTKQSTDLNNENIPQNIKLVRYEKREEKIFGFRREVNEEVECVGGPYSYVVKNNGLVLGYSFYENGKFKPTKNNVINELRRKNEKALDEYQLGSINDGLKTSIINPENSDALWGGQQFSDVKFVKEGVVTKIYGLVPIKPVDGGEKYMVYQSELRFLQVSLGHIRGDKIFFYKKLPDIQKFIREMEESLV